MSKQQAALRYKDILPAVLTASLGPCIETVEKDHGRIEIRRYWQTDDISWINGTERWPGLKTVGIADSTRIIGDTETTERRLFISSLGRDPEQFSLAVRNHWRIEAFHWVMDVSFGEDQCRIRRDHSAENFALMRRTALSLLKRVDDKVRSIKGRRNKAGWDHGFLTRVLREAPLRGQPR